MDVSNIDELLAGVPQPQPEQQGDYSDNEPEDNSNVPEQPDSELSDTSELSGDEEAPRQEPDEVDDYGNKKSTDNEVIRERLRKQAESMERRHQQELDSLRSQLAQQGASQQVQQAAKDFEYNPDAAGDWQQQLASFVKQTVNSMTQEQEQGRVKQREQQAQIEFESKFRNGMSQFNDFADVVGAQPITDAMTVATRAMQDPAAFLYAASKRAPQELERISKISDPYAQMVEVGKLEERMRKNKITTSAPRPMDKTSEDASLPRPKENKELSIEQMIAQSEAKKMAQLKARRR